MVSEEGVRDKTPPGSYGNDRGWIAFKGSARLLSGVGRLGVIPADSGINRGTIGLGEVDLKQGPKEVD